MEDRERVDVILVPGLRKPAVVEGRPNRKDGLGAVRRWAVHAGESRADPRRSQNEPNVNVDLTQDVVRAALEAERVPMALLR